MKLINMEKDQLSYKKPIIKLIAFIILGATCLLVRISIDWSTAFPNVISIVICLPLLIFSIYMVIFSFAEIINVNDNLEKIRFKSLNAKIKWEPFNCSLNILMTLLEAEDIWQVFIKYNNIGYEIGVSSDQNNMTGRFFDKEYYIDESRFKTADDFLKAELFENVSLQNMKEGVTLLSIDGLNPCTVINDFLASKK